MASVSWQKWFSNDTKVIFGILQHFLWIVMLQNSLLSCSFELSIILPWLIIFTIIDFLFCSLFLSFCHQMGYSVFYVREWSVVDVAKGAYRQKKEQKENHLIAKQMVLFFVAGCLIVIHKWYAQNAIHTGGKRANIMWAWMNKQDIQTICVWNK